jgi:hypothetical protein
MKRLIVIVIITLSLGVQAELYNNSRNWNNSNSEKNETLQSKVTLNVAIDNSTKKDEGLVDYKWSSLKDKFKKGKQFLNEKYKKALSKTEKPDTSKDKNHNWNNGNISKKTYNYIVETTNKIKAKYKEEKEKIILKNPVKTYQLYKKYKEIKRND